MKFINDNRNVTAYKIGDKKDNNVINGKCKVVTPLKIALKKLDKFLTTTPREKKNSQQLKQVTKNAKRQLNLIRTGNTNPITHTLNI